MFNALMASFKYGKAIPVAIELVEEIHKAMRDDGSISQKERSKLMSKFWELVRVIQDPKKKTSPASKKAA